MRSWPLLVVFAMTCWSGCWREGAAARPTTPAAAAPGDPTADGPPSSGIRFASRPENRCGSAIAHVFDHSKAEIASSGMSEAFIQEFQDLAVASCMETQWHAETLECLERSGGSSELRVCLSALEQEQQDDFKKRMTELLQRQNGLSTAPPPP